jgi:hypothetical protein
MAAEARRLAPSLSWSAVAAPYARLGDRLVGRDRPWSRETTRDDLPSFAHVSSMSDRIGMFEHADHAVPDASTATAPTTWRGC